MIINFIENEWTSIVFIMIIIMPLIILYKHNRKDLIKKVILGLVIRAERALGSGTGELKYAMVVNEIYETLPVSIRILFSEQDIDSMIEEAVQKLKKVLASNKVNLHGYDEEAYLKLVE